MNFAAVNSKSPCYLVNIFIHDLSLGALFLCSLCMVLSGVPLWSTSTKRTPWVAGGPVGFIAAPSQDEKAAQQDSVTS